MSKTTRTLLLVDDNDTDRHLIRRYLQRDVHHAYQFLEAETGEQALAQCHASSPDCILIDYNLPDTDGLELLAELAGKNDLPLFPIVIMTGEGDETIAVQAMQGGAQDYLVKGKLTPEALLIAVDNAMEKVRLRRSVEAHRQSLQQQNRELQHRQDEIEALNLRLKRSMTETHHRVKNNLQGISAMIEMQIMEHGQEQTIPLTEFVRLKAHVHTLALVHELLTQAVKEQEDTQRVSAKVVLEHLLPMLQSMAWNQVVRYNVNDAELTSKQCIALALALNEMVSNALKHGKSEAEVFFTTNGNLAILTVQDDGAGFPEGFDPKKVANTGLELIGSLSRTDLAGTVCYRNRPEGGGEVQIIFPLPAGIV